MGYMCGVWIALEDIHPDSGPLIIYPRSHRLIPPVYMKGLGIEKVKDRDYKDLGNRMLEYLEGEIEKHRLESLVYTPKRGEVLIWHENLIHGALRRRDLSLTRRSLVGHYYACGAISYYDSLGVPASLDIK